MSRSLVPKSRSDRTRTLSTALSTPQPPSMLEIVPGRFTEADWSIMVSAEDGENHVGDIIDDIVSQALDECYRIYIENQMLPFTIAQAKDAMLQIIEWRFLSSDRGESNVTQEPSWQEDEEPVAFSTDSWAQGSVPIVRLPPTPTLEEQESSAEAPGEALYPEGEDGGVTRDQTVTSTVGQSAGPQYGSVQHAQQVVQNMSPPYSELTVYYPQPDKGCSSRLNSGLIGSLFQEPAEPAAAATVETKSSKLKLTRGCRRLAKQQKVTKSSHQTEKELLLQQGAEPCHAEPPVPPCQVYWMSSYFQNVLKIQKSRRRLKSPMTFDEFGNVSSVHRLQPSQFPRQQVKPRFQLLHVDLEATLPRPLAGQVTRPLMFRSGDLGQGSIPVRYKAQRARQEGLGMLGQVAGGKLLNRGSNPEKPLGAPITAHELKLGDSCTVSATPQFMEFVPDGPKDRNHSQCGWYPEYEEVPNRLRPICNTTFIPPIPVQKLTNSTVQY
uniref:uncharacterized protein C2orf81 homolog isoform X1 n=1 Tax=Pristiophorus japonicus TaxID=55135 RepID=UPI00398F6C2F